MCRAPFVITPSVPQPYPAISQSQFIHSSELRDNHLPTIHQPRLNHTPKDSRPQYAADATRRCPTLFRHGLAICANCLKSGRFAEPHRF